MKKVAQGIAHIEKKQYLCTEIKKQQVINQFKFFTTMATELVSFVKSLNKGTLSTIVTNTEPRMRKTGNPLFGRVRKQTTLNHIVVGVSYENSVNNKSERVGNGEHIESEKPNGKTWVVPNLILRADKDEKQLYLRTTLRKTTTTESFYLVDGRPATEDEVATIKEFLQGSSTSGKQAALGIAEEDQVVVRDYKVENILAIKQGSKKWSAQK